MIREIGSIIGAQVLDFESGDLLAVVSGAIVHPDTGMLEAFWLKPANLEISDAIVQVSSVVELKKNIYIKGEGAIASASDVIRIGEILDEQRPFLGSHVQNEGGKSYGRCYDFTFDTKTFALRQIYTRKMILGLFSSDKRIFSYNNIVRVTTEMIIVDDQSEDKNVVIVTPAEAATG